ncbi:DUF58 domain-containing protein [Jiangella mangrovi]|uniref:Uncharacterized protein (DUF58 family) n=1 Tax=Jiangella mangrovi TaxID=1524084 RepID=A0A7W9GXQ9_9ACTN|nr:DUF58 domain-containing protein [Jiangella mangrovi]MBB5792000.1 uncharacterized protein (DUF58 family) [Jiangella mangrovi]
MIREYRWRASPALARSLLLPALLAATGVTLGRADLVLLGVPLVAGTALALGGTAGRRGRRPPPDVRATGPRVMDVGLPAAVAVVVGPSDAQLVTTVLAAAETGAEAHTVTVAAPESAERQLVTEVTSALWGSQLLARPDHLAAAADGLLVAGPVPGTATTAQVLPGVAAALPPGALPPRPAGMVGAHRTRRPGEGTELHDVSPFQPGDRLRRIDWRVTARQAGPRETLFARHTLVDADADVVCCLDNRFDLGADVATWLEVAATHEGDHAPARSSIDIAVDTVASVAAAYIEHGDRVGVLDLARPLDPVHLGSGRRHLLRLRTHLARHTRRPGSGDALPAPRHAPPLPPGAIVVVTSVFLDDAPGTLAVTWRRRGHPVLVVDVLPSPLSVDGVDAATALAARLVLAERQERIRALEAAGVPVSAADPAALALSLARLRRHARGVRR